MVEIVKDLDFWRMAAMAQFVKTVLWGKKEATMYSYNGTVLPKLPEFENARYCLLVSKSQVVYSSVPIIAYPDEKKVSCGGWFESAGVQTLVDGVWQGENPSGGSFAIKFAYQELYWANHDILDESGTLYLAASEPVEVS